MNHSNTPHVETGVHVPPHVSLGGDGQGMQRVLWWILGGLCTPILLALCGTMLNLGITSAQRISTLEGEFHELHRQNQEISAKLDRLLEKGLR